MVSYTLDEIRNIESHMTTYDNSLNLLCEHVSNFLYTINYKFKDTIVSKAHQGTPKHIGFADIRLSLNKLSNTSYSNQFKHIISTIHVLKNENNHPTLYTDLFTHLSTNAFMIVPYSRLAFSLVHIFDDFKHVFYAKNADILRTITCSPYPTFDDTVQSNKYKDCLKSNILFTSFTAIKLQDYNTFTSNILSIQHNICEFISGDDFVLTPYIVFLSNILSSILKNTLPHLPSHYDIKYITEHTLFVMENKTNMKICRKIIFSHMDMYDMLVKRVVKHVTQ